jgi:hypothetical protein
VFIFRYIILFIAAATILLLTGCAYATGPVAPGEHSSSDFTRAGKCQQCHAIVHSQWDGTMHSNAYTDPFYQKEFHAASTDTEGLVDEFCSRCHTPIGVLSGEIPPADGSHLSEIAHMGVQCDFCHTVSGSSGIGDASFIVTPGNTKWGPFNDSKSASHTSEYLELHTRSEFCGMCHQVTHPVNGLVIDDTYSTWNESYYGQKDVTCQHCHMSPGVTEFKANPGRSASNSPKREHVSLHSTVGGNAFVTGMLGAEKERKLAIERLQKAATLRLDVPRTAIKGEEVTIEVAITNSGAGHMLPTGVSEIRQMWLEVEVTDNQGQMIYRTTKADTSLSTGPSVMYNTVLGDSDGKATLSFWLAEKVIADNRIAPRETVSEQHNFTLPYNISYPLTVEATLNYMSAPQELIDNLFGEGIHEVPVIAMVKASGKIHDPEKPAETQTQAPGFTASMALMVLAALTIALTIIGSYKKQ